MVSVRDRVRVRARVRSSVRVLNCMKQVVCACGQCLYLNKKA